MRSTRRHTISRKKRQKNFWVYHPRVDEGQDVNSGLVWPMITGAEEWRARMDRQKTNPGPCRSQTGGVWYILAARSAKQKGNSDPVHIDDEDDRRLGRAFEGACSMRPTNDPASSLRDPFVHERQMIVEPDHPESGRIRHVAGPKFARARNPRRASELGEHSEEILKERPGM